jgi:hypothetical protein
MLHVHKIGHLWRYKCDLYAFRYLAVQVGVVAAVVKYRRYKWKGWHLDSRKMHHMMTQSLSLLPPESVESSSAAAARASNSSLVAPAPLALMPALLKFASRLAARLSPFSAASLYHLMAFSGEMGAPIPT